MDTVNSVLTLVFDILLWPFSSLSPGWGLLFISVLSGVILLLVYGQVSSQEGIRKTKRRIFSNLLEAVLYRHDLRTSLHAQLKMLGQAFVYFAYAVPPILILMVPCVLILAQLNLRYNSRGLLKGESGILRVQVRKANYLDNVALESDDGLEVTPRLRVADSNEVLWRVTPQGDSARQLTIRVEGSPEQYSQTVYSPTRRNPKIVTNRFQSWWWGLLYPGEELLPQSSPIVSMSLNYPEARYNLLGFHMHWLVVFLLVSILAGIVASKIFKIEI